MKSPLISVIIPAYNTAPYLPRCLDSVLCQTLPDFELILIDDGSTDGTGAIADRYAATDSRVRVIHKENGGVSSARNRGSDVARGQFITFVDSDDTVRPTYLEKLHAALCETGAAISTANWQESSATGRTAYAPSTGMQLLTQDEADDLNLLGSCCARMFRRTAMTAFRFDETIHYGEDTLFTIQNFYGTPGNTLAVLGECLYMYDRSHAGAATAQGFRPERLSQIEAYRRIRQVTEPYPRMTASVDGLRAFAFWNLYRMMIRADVTADYPAELRELRTTLRHSRAIFLRDEPLRARVIFRLCLSSQFLTKKLL